MPTPSSVSAVAPAWPKPWGASHDARADHLGAVVVRAPQPPAARHGDPLLPGTVRARPCAAPPVHHPPGRAGNQVRRETHRDRPEHAETRTRTTRTTPCPS